MSSYAVDPGTVIGRSVEVADLRSLLRPGDGSIRARVRALRVSRPAGSAGGPGPRIDAGPFVTLAHVEGGSVAWTVRTAGQLPGPRTDHLAELERRAARRDARRRAALAVRRWIRQCFQRPAHGLPGEPSQRQQGQQGQTDDRRGVLTPGRQQATARYYEHPANNRRTRASVR
jgi:hypothetical protein